MTKNLKQSIVSMLNDVPSLVDILKKNAPNLKWKHCIRECNINMIETYFDDYGILISEIRDEDGDPKNYDLTIVKGEKKICMNFEASGKISELYSLATKYAK